MLSGLFDAARPAFFSIDPERAHELVLRSMELGIYPRDSSVDPTLACDLAGLKLPNPIGIAAGFDKDGRVPDAVLGLGCGFAEIGTVTPLPQAGNARPRVFRLVSDRGVINRLGFNNEGHRAARERLEQRQSRGGVVGVNIGANKSTDDRTADYVAGLETFYDVASYFSVNVSSPNTPGLRALQAPAALDELLDRLLAARDRCMRKGAPRRPIAVKLAPDIAEADLPAVVGKLVAHQVDAIAVSNTTLSRAGLQDRERAKEQGGLSGRPLFRRSTAVLARVYMLTQGRIPLIGIGGIDSGEAAVAKIEAGASVLQLYTGLVYEGPGLIPRIKSHLGAYARASRLTHIGEATGRRAEEWAQKPLEP